MLKFQALDLQALCLLDLFYILVPTEQTLNSCSPGQVWLRYSSLWLVPSLGYLGTGFRARYSIVFVRDLTHLHLYLRNNAKISIALTVDIFSYVS